MNIKDYCVQLQRISWNGVNPVQQLSRNFVYEEEKKTAGVLNDKRLQNV